jgi:hypothetical protein
MPGNFLLADFDPILPDLALSLKGLSILDDIL